MRKTKFKVVMSILVYFSQRPLSKKIREIINLVRVSCLHVFYNHHILAIDFTYNFAEKPDDDWKSASCED